MKEIKLTNFKCFSLETTISFGDGNCLIFGENGAGKSSVIEALKWMFCKETIKKNIPRYNLMSPDEKIQAFDDERTKYITKNSVGAASFDIKMVSSDGEEVSEERVNINDYDIHFITPMDFSDLREIDLLSLSNSFLNVANLEDTLREVYQILGATITGILKESFQEDMSVEIENATYKCLLKTPQIPISERTELHKKFNEGKLRMVKLIAMCELAYFASLKDKKVIVVLDDPMSSLDAANRTFLIKYLQSFSRRKVGEATSMKLVVMTHNVGFFHLWKYMENLEPDKAATKYCHLVVSGDKRKILPYEDIKAVSKIKENYGNGVIDATDTGNILRKKFETLLVQLSEQLMIGSHVETRLVIESIEKRSVFYRKMKDDKNKKSYSVNTVYDLIDEISKILKAPPPGSEKLSNNIKKIIENYIVKADDLHRVISDLKLYQKITMHPLSHYPGNTTWTDKEVRTTITFLENFERVVEKLEDRSVAIQ